MKLTPEQAQALQQLKDINLPEPISWWPLAIGWWVLGLMCITAIVGIIWYRKKTRLKRAALAELKRLKQGNRADALALAVPISMLLRRVAIKRYGQSVAYLTGKAWEDFLVNHHAMDANTATFLSNAPYKPLDNAPNAELLLESAKSWIRSHT